MNGVGMSTYGGLSLSVGLVMACTEGADDHGVAVDILLPGCLAASARFRAPGFVP